MRYGVNYVHRLPLADFGAAEAVGGKKLGAVLGISTHFGTLQVAAAAGVLTTRGTLSWRWTQRESNAGTGCASVVPGNATPPIPASSWVAFQKRLPRSRG